MLQILHSIDSRLPTPCRYRPYQRRLYIGRDEAQWAALHYVCDESFGECDDYVLLVGLGGVDECAGAGFDVGPVDVDAGGGEEAAVEGDVEGPVEVFGYAGHTQDGQR